MCNRFLKKYLIIFIMVISLGFITPVCAENQPSDSVQNKPAYEFETKVPIGRKQLAIKFIMVMLGVGVSSVMIYVLLTGYNKLVYGGTAGNKKNIVSEDDNFKTPNNMKDALGIFLKKTK